MPRELRFPFYSVNVTAQDADAREYVTFQPWYRRHPVVTILTALALIAGTGWGVRAWVTSSSCGPGMTATGSPWICVGLNLNSAPMRGNDPLAGLEHAVAHQNSQITGSFATVVLLEDMTPDPSNDSLQLQQVRHAIEGAITAVNRANTTSVADGLQPPIKLLLANFGTGADSWRQAVAAIENDQQSEHIVAVTGIGQSLDNTRAAAANLSGDGITTIGADVTADNMNMYPGNKQIPDFFRVAPTNTDEVGIAVRYIEQHLPHEKIMLIKDSNPSDSYAQTLATAFQRKMGTAVRYTETYQSPSEPLPGITRSEQLISQFATEHTDICTEQPDLIYFAGRGIDLFSFLQALAQGSACGLSQVRVMTGDDASNIVGDPLPTGGPAVNVLYTALASADEWTSTSAAAASQNLVTEKEKENYHAFARAFTDRFPATDLIDGIAMLEHDAVLAAAIAVRHDPSAVTSPSTMAGAVDQLHCENSVPGASGFIAFSQDGNPVDKVMPIIQINQNGSTTPKAGPEGPDGQINYNTDTC